MGGSPLRRDHWPWRCVACPTGTGVYHWATSLEDYSIHLSTQAGVWNKYDHCGDWCISRVWGSVLGNSYENMRTQIMELTGQVPASRLTNCPNPNNRTTIVLQTNRTLLLRGLQVTPCSPQAQKKSARPHLSSAWVDALRFLDRTDPKFRQSVLQPT